MDAGTPAEFAVTSITEAEIRYGIARLADGARRRGLAVAADRLFADLFEGRVLPFQTDSAGHYADIVANREARGLPISAFDDAIAAICREREADLATFNTRDFDHTGIRVIEPGCVRPGASLWVCLSQRRSFSTVCGPARPLTRPSVAAGP